MSIVPLILLADNIQLNSEICKEPSSKNKISVPDIDNTLDMAIEWERRHDTVYKLDKVRQVDSSNTTTTTYRSSNPGESESEPVNKIDYILIK